MDRFANCGVGTDCVDDPAGRNGVLGNQIYPGRMERGDAASPVMCSDGVDNDCDGEADFDGVYYPSSGPSIVLAPRGDRAKSGADYGCQVDVLASTFQDAVCNGPDALFYGTCTYAPGGLRSPLATFTPWYWATWNTGPPDFEDVTYQEMGPAVGCTFLRWEGNIAHFSCDTTANNMYTNGDFTCMVNQGMSEPVKEEVCASYDAFGNCESTMFIPKTKTTTVDLHRAGQDCLGAATCLSSGVCPLCDADRDGYNKSIIDGVERCASPTDCNDDNATIHPGAPLVCGNGVAEDCGTCDPYCSLVWDGTVRDNFGDPIYSLPVEFGWGTGPVSTVKTPDPSGFFAVSGVANGVHTLYASAQGYEPFVLPAQAFSCVSPVTVDVILEEASCKADCSFGEFCSPTCVGINGCPGVGAPLLYADGTPSGFTVADGLATCASAVPGTLRTLDDDYKIVCCSGVVIPVIDLREPLDIKGTSENLIRTSKLIFYNGQQVEMVALMYKNP
jgi:hypothetical protein